MHTVVTYALMVGTPVVGAGFALRAGRALEAPPSVGGLWKVSEAPAADACTGLGWLGALRELRIAQSGAAVTLVLRGAADAARLSGTLETSDAPDEALSLRATGDGLELDARVTRAPGADTMRVSLGNSACPGGPTVMAVRSRPGEARP